MKSRRIKLNTYKVVFNNTLVPTEYNEIFECHYLNLDEYNDDDQICNVTKNILVPAMRKYGIQRISEPSILLVDIDFVAEFETATTPFYKRVREMIIVYLRNDKIDDILT